MNDNKFNDIAEIYEKYRPSYPTEYINYLTNKCNLNLNSIVADIGAGTGILSRQLLDIGLKVIGIEPNKDMRKVLKKLEFNENFKAIEGTAEHTNLKDSSVDLITVAQAFHWFDVEKFREECKRILKPQGKVCIIWNKLDITNQIVKEQKEVDYKYTNQYLEVNDVLQDDARENKVKECFKDNIYECKVVDNNLKNDKEKFIGVNLSKSYSLRPDEKFYNEYIEEFEKIFEKYSKDGIIEIANKTYGYLGKIK